MAFLIDLINENLYRTSDRSCVCYSLKVASTMTCGMYAGGALYGSLVEGPAMMTHDSEMAVKMWKSSFIRAKSLMSKLAIISATTSVVAVWYSDERRLNEWLLAGGLVFSNALVTLFILPINRELMETEKCIEKGNEFTIQKLESWHRRHTIRTVVSMGAFGFMVWLLSKNR